LSHIKSRYPEVNVVLITGFGNISSAVEAIRQGAFDYLTKPIQPEELEATIQRALCQFVMAPETSDQDPFTGIIGEDPTMKKLFAMIRSVAASPATVLLEGESGTGKRIIAQAIHRADPKRRAHPFIEISCGALPETLLESELFGHVRGSFTGAIRDKQGRFELAEGGTVLLDEIDAFSPALQVKLLRVIQERVFERVGDTKTMRVDVRIIAATNRTLAELVKQGMFREDLYYRLNVITMRLPALRERKSDLPLLISHFLARSARAMDKSISALSPDALQVLERYPWPGNIRELENVIERAVILSKHPVLDVDDLPEELRFHPEEASLAVADQEEAAAIESAPSPDKALKQALKIPERELILKTLAEVRWNRSEAAKRLGIHRSTLYHKIRQLGIHISP
jgi:DNA-binding NtrC family response regulator